MPAPISDDKLTAWAREHLHYEAGMLVYAAERLAERAGLPGNEESNVLVESFAIHTRCLDDFLWSDRRPGFELDAFAADFCAPGIWERERGERPPALIQVRDRESDRDRTGREIVHLTYRRLEVSADIKPWQVGALTKEITEALHDLTFHALSDRLDDGTRAALRDLYRRSRLFIASGSTAPENTITGGTIGLEGRSDS